MPNTEIMESFVRAEVRRQFAERPVEANLASSLELRPGLELG